MFFTNKIDDYETFNLLPLKKNLYISQTLLTQPIIIGTIMH